MSKISKPQEDYEIPDDYSELLEGCDFTTAVRGKYYLRTQKDVALSPSDRTKKSKVEGVDLTRLK